MLLKMSETATDSDLQLLARYTRDGVEEAFAELAHRHLGLVYSAALRQVRSPQLAEEVAQSAFTDLARNASKLKPDTILTAWLYQVTRRTAIDVVRREARRQLREQIATEMNALNATTADWTHIEPLLDDAMSALDETDRAAVLLRYFENKSLREVGAALGTSDDAAQKRVSRAVERLREFFSKRGITVGASGLLAAISANAVKAAPAGMAAAISTAALLAALGITASAGAGATTGFFGLLVQAARTKLGIGFATAVLVGVVTFIAFHLLNPADSGSTSNALRATAANPTQNQKVAGPANQDANAADDQREPDPLNLLLGVAKARQRMASGSMEFQFSFEHFNFFGSGRRVTNDFWMVALFEGPKRRYEQFTREYSYTYSADEAAAADITKRADSMSREEAVRAGLMKAFESHHVTVYDGSALFDYWLTDGKPEHMTIDDPGKGSAQSVFDPRCLGLSTVLSPGSTVENCLAYNEAKSIALVGEEPVEGVPAWHVQVESKYEARLDFWIEIARPTRVLKKASGSDYALSKYDDANSRDPLPTEVTTMMFRNGSPAFRTRLLRSNSRFNVAVDQAAFTLAGLGIAIGTPVTDVRIHRSIGYWTGVGLAEFPPPKKETNSPSPPNLEELLARLEYNPTWPEALEAGTWILLNTPDGPEVDKATEVILREHTGDTNLAYLCKELERVRHRRSKELLEAILKNNPSQDVRGTACFTLATLLKDEAKFGEDKKATAEAEKQFARVIAEFGQVKQRGFPLEELAKPELSELRRLTIGKPAPEIEGEDLDAHPMKLSDYRGKVVVLTFWWSGTLDMLPEHRKLVERMAGKPVAFLGVYGDDDLAKGKAEAEKYGITWPSFWDKHNGPVSTNWNVRSWPNIWVLDPQGVIRYREGGGRELTEAVEKLLRE